jgi:hypothetical protein
MPVTQTKAARHKYDDERLHLSGSAEVVRAAAKATFRSDTKYALWVFLQYYLPLGLAAFAVVLTLLRLFSVLFRA